MLSIGVDSWTTFPPERAKIEARPAEMLRDEFAFWNAATASSPSPLTVTMA